MFKLEWQGEAYTIPPRRVMAAILAVEDVITVGRLAAAARAGDIPYARIAAAYAVALRAAGADVRDYDVYTHVMAGVDGGHTLETVSALLALMVPPAKPGAAPDPLASGGLTPKRNGSKRRSRRLSGNDGLPLANSGH